MAKIIDVGIANGDMSYITQRGVILVAMAMLSLFFGVQPEIWRQLRQQDMRRIYDTIFFYKVQDFFL